MKQSESLAVLSLLCFSCVFNGIFNAWLLQRNLTKLLFADLHQPSTINWLVKCTTKEFCRQTFVVILHLKTCDFAHSCCYEAQY